MITYLIIDDEHIAHKIIKGYCDLLPNMELKKSCYDGLEAFEYLNRNDVDLIFLDLNMPKMNGIEFLDVVKKDDELRLVPIVVLTTSSDPSDRMESYKRCVAGYMVKSVDYEEFVNTISCVKNYWRSSQLAY